MNAGEYLEGSKRLSVGILAASPLLAFYEAGVRLSGSPVRNGADAVLRRAFLLGFGPAAGRIVFGAAVLALVLGAAAYAVRRRVAAHRFAFPLLLEGLLYAALLGPFVALVRSSFGPGAVALGGAAADSATVRTLLAVGAGVYEEIAFRLVLLSGLYLLAARLLEPLGGGKGLALGLALALSSLCFAAFHHLGPFGAPFEPEAFAFRAIAGGVLGGLFLGRGIGVAIYTHAFYDLLYLAA